jgi:hypothetical protein
MFAELSLTGSRGDAPRRRTRRTCVGRAALEGRPAAARRATVSRKSPSTRVVGSRTPYDPSMSFLGLDLLAWTAIAAIGTLVLAIATSVIIVVTVRMARSDRERDDAKRKEDRQWDSDRRKEDRDRDDHLRRKERERDDGLRREAADGWERRLRAEQVDREDYEARQVTVELSRGGPSNPSPGLDLNHRITISTPATYPIKQVNLQITHWSNANLGILPVGHAGDDSVSSDGRVYYRFWAAISDHLIMPAVIISFVDMHGTLYYNYLHHTRRFPQNTDWGTAAQQIWEWVATGPKADAT